MIALWIFLGFLSAGFIPILALLAREKKSVRIAFTLPFPAAVSAGCFATAAAHKMNDAERWMFGIGIFFAVVMCVLAVIVLSTED